jgi:hypothetical protein
MQLVFCLACLAMAGWTWMRYSYAWDVKPAELAAREFRWLSGLASSGENYYVRLRGVPEGGQRSYEFAPGSGDFLAHFSDPEVDAVGFTVVFEDARKVPATGRVQSVHGRIVRGRSVLVRTPSDDAINFFLVDTARGRFTGASVAGLVVGAMGCFIFGLYLRAWLRERKALAGEPQRDMIA